MTRPRVLVLIKGLHIGGAERIVVDSLPYLDQERFEYHFAHFLESHDVLVPEIHDAGLPVHCLGMKSNRGLLAATSRTLALQHKHRYDLIHAHLPMTGLVGRFIGRVSRIPVVYTEHNHPDKCNRVMQVATRATYSWNSQVFSVSNSVSQTISRLGLDRLTRVVTLRNGIPVDRVRQQGRDSQEVEAELGIDRGDLVIGTVAILSRQKRFDLWIAVAKALVSRHSKLRFFIVGAGPEEARIRSMITEQNLADKITLLGMRTDARKIMNLMHVFLMTSDYEGLPISLLEAMCLGKPIVSTRAGGVPEVLDDEEDGLLTDIGDVEALTDRVSRLVVDQSFREQIGARAAIKVEEGFDAAERVRTIESTYLDLLSDFNSKLG